MHPVFLCTPGNIWQGRPDWQFSCLNAPLCFVAQIQQKRGLKRISNSWESSFLSLKAQEDFHSVSMEEMRKRILHSFELFKEKLKRLIFIRILYHFNIYIDFIIFNNSKAFDCVCVCISMYIQSTYIKWTSTTGISGYWGNVTLLHNINRHGCM